MNMTKEKAEKIINRYNIKTAEKTVGRSSNKGAARISLAVKRLLEALSVCVLGFAIYLLGYSLYVKQTDNLKSVRGNSLFIWASDPTVLHSIAYIDWIVCIVAILLAAIVLIFQVTFMIRDHIQDNDTEKRNVRTDSRFNKDSFMSKAEAESKDCDGALYYYNGTLYMTRHGQSSEAILSCSEESANSPSADFSDFIRMVNAKKRSLKAKTVGGFMRGPTSFILTLSTFIIATVIAITILSTDTNFYLWLGCVAINVFVTWVSLYAIIDTSFELYYFVSEWQFLKCVLEHAISLTRGSSEDRKTSAVVKDICIRN